MFKYIVLHRCLSFNGLPRMISALLGLTLVCVLVFASSVWSIGIFQWLDKDGVTHMTNNIYDVPDELQESVLRNAGVNNPKEFLEKAPTPSPDRRPSNSFVPKISPPELLPTTTSKGKVASYADQERLPIVSEKEAEAVATREAADAEKITMDSKLSPGDCNALITSVTQALTATPKQELTIKISVLNGSAKAFSSKGAFPISIGIHLLDNNRGVANYDYFRAGLTPMNPGQKRSQTLKISAPDKPGDYYLAIDLVQEGVFWFEANGSKPVLIQLKVTPAPKR
ncbi:MAG: hypothetical protein HQK60_03540 [Deltaproteobacteria bacterium]|nr:hypothetical protein [Deltaproteobacteria bacterium]